MANKTAIVWIDGERYVFRDEQIAHIFKIGEQADDFDDAWRRLKEFGEQIDA